MRGAIVAIGLVACGDSVDTDTDVALTACEGAGEATVEVGSGGRSNFVAYEDGASVGLEQDASASWGLPIELLTTGLDTTEGATSVVRITWDPGEPTEDYVGQVMLQCDDEAGIAWISVMAAVPEPWQSYPASLAGATITVSVTITDASGETATDALDLVIAGR